MRPSSARCKRLVRLSDNMRAGVAGVGGGGGQKSGVLGLGLRFGRSFEEDEVEPVRTAVFSHLDEDEDLVRIATSN